MSLGRRFLTTGGVVPFTGSYSVDYLVIGGGGSGNSGGGGGGAGGYRNSFNNETSGANCSSLTARTMTAGDGVNYIVQIGAGGAAGTNSGDTPTMNAQGTKGGETSFHISGFSFQVFGQGGGCGGYAASSPTSKQNGGCGGGGVFGTGQGGAGFSCHGMDGSDGHPSNGSMYSGSGGGASQGAAGTNQTNGFAGLHSSITGSDVGRAGGGSGGQWSGIGSTGQDGGGNGQSNGTANTGGGGGGGGRTGTDQTTGFRSIGSGASGVIILRMPTAAYLTASTTGSPTVTTDGTDTILTYTGSGSYTS